MEVHNMWMLSVVVLADVVLKLGFCQESKSKKIE